MLATEGQQTGSNTTAQPCRHCRILLSKPHLDCKAGDVIVSRAGLAARRQTAADLPSPAAMLHAGCVGHSPLGGMVGKLGLGSPPQRDLAGQMTVGAGRQSLDAAGER